MEKRSRPTTDYFNNSGAQLNREFQKKLTSLVLKYTEGKVEDDGYIHLDSKTDIDIVMYVDGKPKLRHIKVWRITPSMHIVGGHGEWILPEMLSLFNWEVILRNMQKDYDRRAQKTVR